MAWIVWFVPGAAGVAGAHAEVCNGLDDDGDGAVDEGPVAYGFDVDGDGYGSATTMYLKATCSNPAGTVPNLEDCDDGDLTVAPGAMEACNGRDDDCDGEIDEGTACAAEVAVDAGSVWHRWDLASTWSDAEAACVAAGMHLASVDDAAVQAVVAGLVAPLMSDVWVGGTDEDLEGVWTWTDGTPFGYAAWRAGQPDDGGMSYTTEDCIEVTSAGTWNDRACDVPLPYLCERACGATWFPDDDDDGLGDGARGAIDCTAPDGWVANGMDCDDGDSLLPAVVYADGDGDGVASDYGYAGCFGPTQPGGDCDDTSAGVHPGAPEIAGDGIDQDCDGFDLVDPGSTPTTPLDTGTTPLDTGTAPTGTAPTDTDTTPPDTGTTPTDTVPGDLDGDGVLDPAEAAGALDDAGGAGRGSAPTGPGACATGGPRGGGSLVLLAAAALSRARALRRRAGARRTCSPRPPCCAR